MTVSHTPPILMSHPGSDILWIDEDGIGRRPLCKVPLECGRLVDSCCVFIQVRHWPAGKAFVTQEAPYGNGDR
jgi:hypothetical protein